MGKPRPDPQAERARDEAERELAAYAAVVLGRDDTVMRALAAGISKHRVHVLTGIARTTIDRIISPGAEEAIPLENRPQDEVVRIGEGH